MRILRNMNFNRTKNIVWILALCPILFSSCIRNALKNPCSWPRRLFNGENIEACYRKHYWGFKPVVKKDNNGNISYAWKLCQAKRNFGSLKHELFVIANKNDKGEVIPEKGFPRYVDGGIDGAIDMVTGGTIRYGQSFPISRALVNVGEYKSENRRLYNSGYEIRDENGRIYKNEGNDAVMVALRECQDYNYFKAAAVANGCLNTFDCLPNRYYNRLDNCTRRGNGENDFSLIPCPPLKELPALFSPDNQEKQILINGISTLYQHKENVDGRVIGSDYQVSASSDFIIPPNSNRISNPRYAYLEVKIGDGYIGNKDNRHKISISNSGTNIADIVLAEQAVTGIRNCKSFEQGYKQYVIECPLTGIGSYDVKVIDMDNGLGTVAQTSLVVAGSDKIDPIDDQEYESYDRKFKVITININNTGKIFNGEILPSLGSCGLLNPKLNKFKDALEDLYALNQKTTHSEDNYVLNKGIKIDHADCILDPTLKKIYFDDSGNLKVKIQNVADAWDQIKRFRGVSMLDAYEIAVSNIAKEIHSRHSGGCAEGGFADIEKVGVAVLVGGIQLANDIDEVISFSDESKAKDGSDDADLIDLVGAPATAYSQEKDGEISFLLGSTYSSPFDDIDNKLKQLQHSTTVFVYASHALKSFANQNDASTFNLDIKSIGTIVASHELGAHVWGQPYMLALSEDQADGHSFYCTGYNSSVCNVRYDNGGLNTWRQYSYHGIVFCEAHKHLLLNQLLRKNYDISNNR